MHPGDAHRARLERLRRVRQRNRASDCRLDVHTADADADTTDADTAGTHTTSPASTHTASTCDAR